MRRLISVLISIMVLTINAYAVEVSYIDAGTGEWVNVQITDEPAVEEDVAVEEPQRYLEDLGDFTATWYCPCSKCNGKNGAIDGFGNPLKWGCVAVDPHIVPLRTKLMIEGYEDTIFEARDTGSGVDGKHIDIFIPVSHKEALNMPHYTKRRIWRVIE